MTIRKKTLDFIRWTERYTKTDMLYLVRGGFWLSLTSGVISLITFIKMIVFGRYLPQETYGIYTYIISIAGILAIFSLTGINTSIIRSIAQSKEGTFLLAVKTRIKWGLIGSFISLTLSIWYFFNQNNLLSILFLISAVFLPFVSTFDISLYYFQAKKRFKDYAKYEILANIFISILIIPAVLFTNNIIIIVFLFFFSQFIFYGYLTKKVINNLENKEEDKKAIIFGKDLTLITAILVIAEYIDKIIIWKFLGPVQVAIYSFAQIPLYKINGLVPVVALALPRLGEINIREMKQSIIKKFKKLFIISIPFSLFVFIFAPILYKIVIPQYIDSIPYFRAFAIILLLSPFGLISSALISDGRKKELYILNTVFPILKIFLFVILTPLFGIWGIIFSVLFSRMLSDLLSFYYFIRI